jgi:hypothetical protein
MTSGAVCACDGGAINCIAVRAVVASSTRRRFVMVWSPEFSWQKGVGKRFGNKISRINEQALGRIVAAPKGGLVFISEGAKPG